MPTAQDAQQQKCSAVHLLGVYTCTWVGANPFKGSATTSAAKPLLLLLLWLIPLLSITQSHKNPVEMSVLTNGKFLLRLESFFTSFYNWILEIKPKHGISYLDCVESFWRAWKVPRNNFIRKVCFALTSAEWKGFTFRVSFYFNHYPHFYYYCPPNMQILTLKNHANRYWRFIES